MGAEAIVVRPGEGPPSGERRVPGAHRGHAALHVRDHRDRARPRARAARPRRRGRRVLHPRGRADVRPRATRASRRRPARSCSCRRVVLHGFHNAGRASADAQPPRARRLRPAHRAHGLRRRSRGGAWARSAPGARLARFVMAMGDLSRAFVFGTGPGTAQEGGTGRRRAPGGPPGSGGFCPLAAGRARGGAGRREAERASHASLAPPLVASCVLASLFDAKAQLAPHALPPGSAFGAGGPRAR